MTKKSVPIKKQLDRMLLTGDFGCLGQFREKESWTKMSGDEKELLGTLFVMQGERQLEAGDRQVLETFKIATKIAPKSALILYRQAIAFASQEHNMYCLTSACRLFEKLTQIDPELFDAWLNWGNVLVKLGVFSNEATYFEEAHQVFQSAEPFIQKNSSAKIAALYRHWGVCWYYLGKLSGEAIDFRKAMSHYQKAFEHGLENPEAWNDYGNALVELALLINNHEYLLEAVEYYWKAIKEDPEFLEGWLNLGDSFKRLFQITHVETYAKLAGESFESASKLDSDNGNLWMNWGQLLLLDGKVSRDLDKLREALKKFEIANKCESNHSQILASWAETLMVYGSFVEELEPLHLAVEKFTDALEIQPENGQIWASYARCLMELGYYFSDPEYYKQAIAKFQHALTLKRDEPLTWYGIVLAHAALGELNNDRKSLKQAARLCMRVMDCGGDNISAFWNDWGTILMRLATMTNEKRYVEAAITKFEQAIRLKQYDSRSDTVEPEWLYNYGCALDFLGDFIEPKENYEKSVQVLTRVLEIDPHFYLAHFNLASALSHFGEYTSDVDSFYQALEEFECFLEYDPEDEAAWFEWGVTLLNLTQLVKDPSHPEYADKLYQQAEQKFMQAIALGHKAAPYYLACLYSLTGNNSEAIYYLERAEKNGEIHSLDDLMHDDWLDGVRKTSAFDHFVSDLREKQG